MKSGAVGFVCDRLRCFLTGRKPLSFAEAVAPRGSGLGDRSICSGTPHVRSHLGPYGRHSFVSKVFPYSVPAELPYPNGWAFKGVSIPASVCFQMGHRHLSLVELNPAWAPNLALVPPC